MVAKHWVDNVIEIRRVSVLYSVLVGSPGQRLLCEFWTNGRTRDNIRCQEGHPSGKSNCHNSPKMREKSAFFKARLEVKLRIGSVNVGSMTRRSGEVADMAARRRLDFCCLQKTKWKGGQSRWMGNEGARYKFYWMGGEV